MILLKILFDDGLLLESSFFELYLAIWLSGSSVSTLNELLALRIEVKTTRLINVGSTARPHGGHSSSSTLFADFDFLTGSVWKEMKSFRRPFHHS